MTEESSLIVQIQTPSGDWMDVGYLHNRKEKNWFEFADPYWEQSSRPVLGQIFEEHGRAWQPNVHSALPRWFSHLLPEGRLREAVATAANIKSSREFELIRRLGSTDLPGAVRAIESDTRTSDSRIPHTVSDRDHDEDDPLLKFSLAGAQLKFSVYGDERGLTVPASGQAGNFIMKFPDGRAGFDGVPEAELASLELARAVGIRTPQAHLVEPADVAGLEEWAAVTTRRALAVKRFDRKGKNFRIHMEELAQILNIPTARDRAKYKGANFETVAIFIGALAGIDSVGETIDRIVLNILIGNGDAHLKNWAFVYVDGRHPTLSPVYDVLPTVLYIPNDDLGLNLNKSKSFSDVHIESFTILGSRSGYGGDRAQKRARAAVERVREEWTILKSFLSKKNFTYLNNRLNELPLAKL